MLNQVIKNLEEVYEVQVKPYNSKKDTFVIEILKDIQIHISTNKKDRSIEIILIGDIKDMEEKNGIQIEDKDIDMYTTKTGFFIDQTTPEQVSSGVVQMINEIINVSQRRAYRALEASQRLFESMRGKKVYPNKKALEKIKEEIESRGLKVQINHNEAGDVDELVIPLADKMSISIMPKSGGWFEATYYYEYPRPIYQDGHKRIMIINFKASLKDIVDELINEIDKIFKEVKGMSDKAIKKLEELNKSMISYSINH